MALLGLQLIPLQPPLRLALSPASLAVDRALFFNTGANPLIGPPRPLSIDPAATSWALLLGAALFLIFWSARAIFERRSGLRVVSRGIVWFGLVLSVVAFVQHAKTPRLIYGFWKPITQTSVPLPYGPFVSRNDLATWLLMALPVAAGYMLARLGSTRRKPDGGANIDAVVDARMAWLAASVCLMLALLLASTSRSGIAGTAFGLLTILVLGRRRVSGGQFFLIIAGAAAAALAATMYVSVPALTARFGDVLGPDLGRGRITIWKNTVPMARDFWLTGLGVGAFERGMLVYQETPRLLFFNQAHDEYLQLFVEGGIIFAGAVAWALVAGWREVMGRLRRDTSPVFWIRVGAAGAMAGVAVQSVWDTGLRMPANGVLFAIVAAMALHEPNKSVAGRGAG
jgi:O-antigen ligase